MSNQKSGGCLLAFLISLIIIFMILPIARGVFFGGLHGGFHFPGFMLFSDHIQGVPFVFAPALVMLIVWVAIAAWVYQDAEQKGMSGILWALLVFVGNIVGLIIYLIVRSGAAQPVPAARQSKTTCPSCNAPVQADFKVCAQCGAQLKGVCPNCDKNVKNDWKVCPYCGEKLNQH